MLSLNIGFCEPGHRGILPCINDPLFWICAGRVNLFIAEHIVVFTSDSWVADQMNM